MVYSHIAGLNSSGPQPFWHQGSVSRKTIFPWIRGGLEMIQVHYIYCILYLYYYYTVIYNEIITQLTNTESEGVPSLFSCNQMVELRRQCEQRGTAINADEASLAHPSLTSCSAAWFLTDHGLVLGFADPCSTEKVSFPYIQWKTQGEDPGCVTRDCSLDTEAPHGAELMRLSCFPFLVNVIHYAFPKISKII